MSLNGTPVSAEDKEIEMLIIVNIATLKRSSKIMAETRYST